MKAKRYTVAEAQRNFEKLIREAERGEDVYIVDDEKQMVKLVPLAKDNKRKPGGFEEKVAWTPDAFDPLTDEEMEDLGFE